MGLIASSLPLWFLAVGFVRVVQGGDWNDAHLMARAIWLVLVAVLIGVPTVLVILGTGAAVRGGLDIVTGRSWVEGEVLHVSEYRKRLSGKGGLLMWWVIVDDGSSTEVRPWVVFRPPTFTEGAVIRASVTRRLAHVKDLEVLRPRRTGDPPTSDIPAG